MKIHLLTSDTIVAHPNFLATALSLIATLGDRGVFHLRTRILSGKMYVSIATQLANASHAVGGQLIVNERVDVALASNADGVQLGRTAMPLSDVAMIFGDNPHDNRGWSTGTGAGERRDQHRKGSYQRNVDSQRLLIGTSVHSASEVEQLVRPIPNASTPDWILLGHVFETDSHPNEPALGIDVVAQACALTATTSSPIPIIAVGGIRPQHLTALKSAGVAGVAILSGIWDAKEPNAAATDYLS